MEKTKNESQQNRIFIMATFILAAGSIYLIPYMRQTYHKPLLAALNISNTQLGLLNSIFGIFASLSYIPGGILADKVSPRKLLTFSLAATGISGIYFSTFPSFAMLIALNIFWGIVTILPFWAAIIKAVRLWGNSDDQARSFGIFDGGRGIFEATIISAGVALFAYTGSGTQALGFTVIIYSSVALIGAIFIWFFMKDSNDEESSSISMGEILSAIKIPEVWLIAIVVFCAYSGYVGTFDLTPFASDGFNQSETFGAH
jgi:predicted MFS family arabinose efflux permease